MKEVILAGASIAALAFAAPAMSESLSPDPASDRPAGCVPGLNNCSVIDQTGDDHFNFILQNDFDYNVIVQQYDGSFSFVTQSGSGNNATVTQGVAPI